MTASPSPGPIAATVAGRVIEAEVVEARLAAVARGAMADWLPAAGVEDRRWRRWMAHLLVTEALVWHEAGLDPDNADLADDVMPTSNGSHPEGAARLEAAARSLFDRVTAGGRCRGRGRRRLLPPQPRSLSTRGATAGQSRADSRPESALGPRKRLDAGEDIAAVAAEHLHRCRDTGTVAAGSARCGVGRWPGHSRRRSSPAPERSAVGPSETEFGWHVALVECGAPSRGHAVRGGPLGDRGRPAQRRPRARLRAMAGEP